MSYIIANHSCLETVLRADKSEKQAVSSSTICAFFVPIWTHVAYLLACLLSEYQNLFTKAPEEIEVLDMFWLALYIEYIIATSQRE